MSAFSPYFYQRAFSFSQAHSGCIYFFNPREVLFLCEIEVIRADRGINWSELAQKATRLLKPFFRFKKNEKLYLNLMEDKGIYQPEILFPEPDLRERLSRHPVLLWKAQNRNNFLKKKS